MTERKTTTAVSKARLEEFPPRLFSSQEPPGKRMPGMALLEVPSVSLGAAGVNVPERPLDGELASGTPRAKRRRRSPAHGGGVAGVARDAPRRLIVGNPCSGAPPWASTAVAVGCCQGRLDVLIGLEPCSRTGEMPGGHVELQTRRWLHGLVRRPAPFRWWRPATKIPW